MLNQLNISIFNFINHFAGNSIFLDNTMIMFAKYLPIIFVFALSYLWFKDRGYKNISLYTGYSAILAILINFVITLFYFHPRPFMEHIGTLLIKHTPETSFPSDHTTFMLSIAFMLLYFKKARKIGTILSALGFIGGIARVYCGLHFPLDIVGSILVATVSSCIIFLSKEKLQKFNTTIINLYNKVLKYEN